MAADERTALETIVAPIMSENGLVIFDLMIHHHRGVTDIELSVDYPNGGIGIEDCARVNQMIVAVLDDCGIYGDDYTVTVGSPGLDRPLKTQQDFQRVTGSKIDVFYRDLHDDKDCHVQGIMQLVHENQVFLKEKTGAEVGILLKYIQKAYVTI